MAETFIAELVKMGGGYILAAFAILILNEVWKARFKDQCNKTAEVESERRLLLDTLGANTKTEQEIVLTLQAMQAESRASSEKILASVQGMTVALAERAAAAAESASHARVAAETAAAAAEAAAKAARTIKTMKPTRVGISA